MAAFGIEYRPQFIQSDIGAMQRKFDDMQQAYDQSYMGSLSAEDQFNQLEVNPVDIGLKNEIIGGFRNKVQSIVDKYGGDWGAAAKQLAREVVKTKQDPFFQLASKRNQLAEEQRRLKQQYGPDAIVTADINKVALKDSEGKYIDPSQLQYEVLHRGQFKEMLNKELGHLAKNVTEGQFVASKNIPWQMERKITTGITANDIPSVAKQGYDLIKKQNPNIPDDVAMDIAMNEAKSYVGDIRTDYTENAPWKIAQEKAMYKWQIDQKAADDEKKKFPRPLFDPEVSTLTDYNDEPAKRFNSAKSNIAEVSKNMRDFKAKISQLDAQIKEKEDLFKNNKSIKNPAAELKLRKKQLEDKLNVFRKQYVSAESEFGPLYKSLKDSGLSSSEALSAVEKSFNSSDGTFKTTLWSQNPNIDRAVKNYETYDGEFFIQVPGKSAAKKIDGGLSEYLGKEGTTIVRSGTDFGSGMQVFQLRHKGGGTTSVYVPYDKSSNETVNIINRDYSSIKNAYNGNMGLGIFIPDGNGNTIKVDENVVSQLPNGYTVVTVGYDSNSKKVERDIHKVFNGALTKSGQYTIGMEAENTAVELDNILGTETKYKSNEIQGGN